jgi:hypothetical protein
LRSVPHSDCISWGIIFGGLLTAEDAYDTHSPHEVNITSHE